MGIKLELDYRELCTIADLTSAALEKDRDGGSYQRRSLVRLALVIDQQGRGRFNTGRLAIMADAPKWVYEYLARPIIELTPPVEKKPKPRRAPQPAPKIAARKRPGKAAQLDVEDA